MAWLICFCVARGGSLACMAFGRNLRAKARAGCQKIASNNIMVLMLMDAVRNVLLLTIRVPLGRLVAPIMADTG